MLEKSFLLIYITSFFLFSYAQRVRTYYSYKKSPLLQSSFYVSKKKQMQASFDHKELVPLFFSYLAADKKGLSKKIKNLHARLNLKHLFTPSGLHLTSFLLLITWIPKYLPALLPLYQVIFPSILILFLFFLGDFYALHRLALFKLLSFILKSYFKQVPILVPFLLAFAFDFSFGHFYLSPLGFCFSFLFLGCLFTNSQKKSMNLFIKFFLAHVLISFFIQKTYAPMGILLSFPLTCFFTFMFPLLIVLFIIGLYAPMELILKIYLMLLEFLAPTVTLLGSYQTSSGQLFCMVLLALPRKLKKYVAFLIPLIILLEASTTNNRAHYKKIQTEKIKLPVNLIKKKNAKRTSYGHRLDFKHKGQVYKCRVRVNNFGNGIKCNIKNQ